MISAERFTPVFNENPEVAEARNWARGVFESPQFQGFVTQAEEKPDDLPDGLIPWLAKSKMTSLANHNPDGTPAFTRHQKAVIFQEASRVHPGIGLDLIAMMTLVASPLIKFGTQQQIDRFLPGILDGTAFGAYALTTVNRGSDAARNDTIAESVPGGWVLDYRKDAADKMFITLGEKADFLLTTIRTGKAEDIHHNLSLILIPTNHGTHPNIQFERHKKLGQPGSPLYQIRFNKLFVPVDAVLGGEKNIDAGWDFIVRILQDSRAIGISSQGAGLSQGAMEEAIIQTLKPREIFNQPNIMSLPETQNTFEVINRQNALVRQIIHLAASYQDENHLHAAAVASLAKYSGSDTAVFGATESNDLLGGAGYLPGSQAKSIMYLLASFALPKYEGGPQVQQRTMRAHGFQNEFFEQFSPPKPHAASYMDPNTIISPELATEMIAEKMNAT